MKTLATKRFAGQLSQGQRGMRLVVGSTLILIAMFYQGPFAAVALLPLLAVYPLFTGLIGVDPVYLVWQQITGVRKEFNIVSRVLLTGSAAILIGSVMAGQGEMGGHGILALVAVYPVLAVIVGRDPLNGFVSKQKENVVQLQTTTSQPDHVRKAA